MSLLRYFEFCQSRAFQMKLSYKNLEKKLEHFLRVGNLRLKPVIKSVGAADFSRRLSVTEIAAAAAGTYERVHSAAAATTKGQLVAFYARLCYKCFTCIHLRVYLFNPLSFLK